jgi:hypothetical protein
MPACQVTTSAVRPAVAAAAGGWRYPSGRGLSGRPATQDHVYPIVQPCVLFAPYLGILVEYDQNGEVVDKAYFNVCGP